MRLLIESLVFSLFVYSLCLGPSLSVNLLHHITRLHNREVHMISGLRKYDHVSHYRFVIGWLNVSSVIPYHSLVAMYMQYRCNHCLLLNLQIKFGRHSSYHTRTPASFASIFQYNLSFSKKCFSIKGNKLVAVCFCILFVLCLTVCYYILFVLYLIVMWCMVVSKLT